MISVSTRLQEIATKVMDHALPIQAGQTVTFMAGGHNLDLAYAFAAECSIRDIEALIITEPDYVSDAKLRKAPLNYFQRAPQLGSGLIELSDWIVLMAGSRHDRSIFQVPDLKERLIEIQRVHAWTFDHIVQFCLSTETRLIAFLDPGLQMAQTLGLSFDETKDKFLQSLDIDYEALKALGEQLISELRGAKEIHLTSPKGTDLYVHPGERPWVNDDGISPRSVGITPYIGNLPVGEVFAAPLEDLARGILLPENLPGSLVRDLRIEFRGSEPAQLSAEEGLDYLLARLENATGFPYCIAEFAIGTNPCGDPVLATEKAYGTAHVAIGQNTWLGGENECSVHWDFLVDKPIVTVDGKCILEDGEFAL